MFRDDSDRLQFTALFQQVLDDHGWKCWALCIMGTHYHALLDTTTSSLSDGAYTLHKAYAKYWNARESTRGGLFNDRFFSVPIVTHRHLVAVARYIALNPVAAGLVKDPAAWPWSTHSLTCAGKSSAIVTVEPLLEIFESHAGKPGAIAYTEFVAAGINSPLPRNPRDLAIDRPALHELLSVPATDAQIERAHLVHAYPTREIAAFLGCDGRTVARRLERHAGHRFAA